MTGLYFTVHPNANPEISYVPWVVSENPVDGMGDISHVTLKTQVMTVSKNYFKRTLCKIKVAKENFCFNICLYNSSWQ